MFDTSVPPVLNCVSVGEFAEIPPPMKPIGGLAVMPAGIPDAAATGQAATLAKGIRHNIDEIIWLFLSA